jgi:hypothetical protein
MNLPSGPGETKPPHAPDDLAMIANETTAKMIAKTTEMQEVMIASGTTAKMTGMHEEAVTIGVAMIDVMTAGTIDVMTKEMTVRMIAMTPEVAQGGMIDVTIGVMTGMIAETIVATEVAMTAAATMIGGTTDVTTGEMTAEVAATRTTVAGDAPPNERPAAGSGPRTLPVPIFLPCYNFPPVPVVPSVSASHHHVLPNHCPTALRLPNFSGAAAS